MTIILSAKLEPLFCRAGWHPGRTVDVSRHIQHLERHGCSVGPLAKEFLQSFMGLQVEGIRPVRLSVDVDEALFWFPDKEGGRYIESFLGEPGCPVAYLRQGSLVLVVGTTGRCANLKDDWLGCVDTDGLNDAVERMLVPGQSLARWRLLKEEQQPEEFRKPD